MKFHLFNPDDYTLSEWAGGTTTQLYIYPPKASYKKQNFLFRISTAKVEQTHSEFTSLPGFLRKLMILDGTISINHKEQYSKKLNKFDTDTFDGGWQTTSEGICTDFNLMTTGSYSGNLMSLILKKNSSFDYQIAEKIKYLFIFVNNGELNIVFNDKNYHLNKNYLLKIFALKKVTINFIAALDTELVITEIFKNPLSQKI